MANVTPEEHQLTVIQKAGLAVDVVKTAQLANFQLLHAVVGSGFNTITLVCAYKSDSTKILKGILGDHHPSITLFR